ncbi:M24 family metallopeptidase C-terminal domain-containing protein [Shewanella corallii]
MFEFTPMTLIPIDLRLLDKSLMTQAEISWLNSYHTRVFRAISPLLSGDELDWLTKATQAI